MELIKNLGTKLNKNGYLISYGIFLCPFCNNEVERPLSDGKKGKSCGCVHDKLISESKKGKSRTEETKQKIKENHTHLIGKNSPLFGRKYSIEHRQKLSKTRVEKGLSKGKNSPFYGKKFMGKDNPNWNNGSSFEPYAPEFNKPLKQQILERDNYTCQDPNCKHKSNKLAIHHIDYNKQNNNPENLITLCAKCHGKSNFNRKYFIEFYRSLINNIL